MKVQKEIQTIIEESIIAVREEYLNGLNAFGDTYFPLTFISEADFQALMLSEIWKRIKNNDLARDIGVTNEFRFGDYRRVDTLIYERTNNGTFFHIKNKDIPDFMLIRRVVALIEFKAHWGQNKKKINKDINTDIVKLKKPLCLSVIPKKFKDKNFSKTVKVDSKYTISFNYLPSKNTLAPGIDIENITPEITSYRVSLLKKTN
jgi:hypothetical protein